MGFTPCLHPGHPLMLYAWFVIVAVWSTMVFLHALLKTICDRLPATWQQIMILLTHTYWIIAQVSPLILWSHFGRMLQSHSLPVRLWEEVSCMQRIQDHKESSFQGSFMHCWLESKSINHWKIHPKTNMQFLQIRNPDSKVHGANMGPTWVLSAPDGPHVGPMNLAVREHIDDVEAVSGWWQYWWGTAPWLWWL